MRGAVADEWMPIETAPKDGSCILGWCDHETDPYTEDESGRSLTIYGGHAEGNGHVCDGAHVVQWGGGWSDEGFRGEPIYMPDWWFQHGSDFEIAANPIFWKPVGRPPF